jgi:hypothetical protein
LWFDSWKNNVQKAHALGQEGVIVYKKGCCGDDTKGLGNSQKGEVVWLQESGIPIQHKWDIDDFKHLIRGATDEKVWAEASARKVSQGAARNGVLRGATQKGALGRILRHQRSSSAKTLVRQGLKTTSFSLSGKAKRRTDICQQDGPSAARKVVPDNNAQ